MGVLDPILRFRSVSKRYVSEGVPVEALREVSLDIARGRLVALLGRSGCGKSTLLNLAGAMDLPSSGEVLIDGQATALMDDAALTKLRRERVGFVFQSFQLLPTLTARENVELPLLLSGKSNPGKAALDRLQWVELQDLADRYPHQMSGGQMQRVAIARALVHEPVIILADEPTGNLDSTTGDLVLRLLRRVVDEFHCTLLMATHSRESLAFVDQIVEMKDGRIEANREAVNEWTGSRSSIA